MVAQRPPDSGQTPPRVLALRAYDILDTPPEAPFDRFVELARHVFDVPISLLTFIDEDREWIKARRNFPHQELRTNISLGVHALRTTGPLVVEDARNDVRFAENPLVKDRPGIRFYAGTPLVSPDGFPIGTIAVADTTVRAFSDGAVDQLSTLASLVMETIKARGTAPKKNEPDDAPLDLTKASTVILDEEGTILQSSTQWQSFAETLSSIEADPPQGDTTYLDLFSASVGAQGTEFIKRAGEGLEAVLRGNEQSFEMVFPCHDPDQNRWFHLRAMQLDHPTARAVVTHQNVTDLKRHRHRRRFLETAVEQAREVVLITEGAPIEAPGPRITYVNPAFTEITGYSPHEVIGKTPRILQGPDTEPWVLDEMRDRLKQGKPFEGEAINYRKDGTPYVNQWSIAPVYDETGTLTHWVSVQRDVSEDRQMEKRLLQAQEQERHRIARTMHDEMGGLLASLQMAIDSAQMAESDDPVQLNEIQNVANELSSVVRTLTERLHSRVLEDYGLSRALPRLADQFRDPDGLTINIHNELSPADSLPDLLEQIAYRGLYEALSNVDRHAEADQVQLLVNCEEKKVRIHVIDDGAGFSPATELNTDDQHGLLGLKERIVRLNGKLEIDSAPGAGTRISMTLPLTLASLLEQTDAPSAFNGQKDDRQ